MRIVMVLCLLCSTVASSEIECDDNDCLDDFNEVDDVIARGGPRFACRPLTEYIECLAEHLGNCPTQHKTAVLGAKSRWTQYISSCALTLPFQEEDSREDTLAEQIQRGSDEVRSNLNGVVSLSQPNLNRFLMAPENAVIENIADVAENIVENAKETVDEVIDNSLDGPEGMDDVVENVRDIIVSKINSAQPILQQFADKLETKRDDVNTDSNAEDVDEAQSEETDDTQRIGDDRQSTEVDVMPTLDSVSVEVLDDIVDFLNDHLSADDGNIDTELDAGDSGDSQENDDSKHIESEVTDDSNENIDDSKDDDVESNEDNETDDSKETVEDDNSENADLDSQESNSQEDIVDTDNSDENDNNDESIENDSDEFDDDSHDKTDDHSQNDSDENDSHDDKIDKDDSDENSGYRHGEADDSQEDDQNSDENDNVSSDENDDNHHHADSHDNLEELSDLTLLSDPSTGTANTGGNARLRPGMGVGGVHQYSSMGDGNSGALITPWTTLLVLCVALVISTF